MNRLLLVEDDPSQLKVISYQLQSLGYEVFTASSAEDACTIIKEKEPDIIISDYRLPGMSGLELLRKCKSSYPEAVFIMITAHGSVEDAVRAVKYKADDYIMKPFSIEQLQFSIQKALRLKKLSQENVKLKSQLRERYSFGNMVGISKNMRDVFTLALKAAQTDFNILILGESGTGKELLARGIHGESKRKEGPFIALNCAAIPGELMESELFGHEKGAFTGAIKRHIGKFEQANGGTLFLDEIGDLNLPLQSKLLRAIQERTIERVGGTSPIEVDIRIIAATNQDLKTLMEEKRFRDDLYYRLNVVSIRIPPVRERKKDILPLFTHFLKKYSDSPPLLSEEVEALLLSYPWHGNVREIENTAQYCLMMTEGKEVKLHSLPPEMRRSVSFVSMSDEEELSLEEMEKSLIHKALQKTQGNQSKAAKLLKIPRHKLLYKLEKYGIK